MIKIIASFVLFGIALASVIELGPEELLDIAHGDMDDTWFIKFYGPDCGFCKSMAGEWEKFAKEVEEEELDIKVGAYNVHIEDNQTPETQIFFPGPLPGLHLFPPQDKKYYEFPNPRVYVNAEQYLNFAIFDYENIPTGVYRKQEYLYQEESAIVSIPGEEFDSYLEKAEKPYFIMFFGPKCGWCKQFLPKWEKFAQETIENDDPWVVARMDGFTNMQIIERYTARPWPSLVYIENGQYFRMDTDIVREIESSDELFDWISSGEYLEVGDEYTGTDEGYLRYLKVKQAKEKSRKRKKERENKTEL